MTIRFPYDGGGLSRTWSGRDTMNRSVGLRVAHDVALNFFFGAGGEPCPELMGRLQGSEIDGDAIVAPAERVKTNTEHVVPITTALAGLLGEGDGFRSLPMARLRRRTSASASTRCGSRRTTGVRSPRATRPTTLPRSPGCVKTLEAVAGAQQQNRRSQQNIRYA
jgi:hypothetical protein